MDGGAHADDALQRQTEEPGELGDQVNGIEGTAENCHGHGAHDQAEHGGLLRLADMVDDDRRQDQGAADDEVGKVSHEGRGGAGEQTITEKIAYL